MKKKWLCICMSMLLVLSVFAGCGKEPVQSDGTTNDAGTTLESTAAQSTEPTTEAPAEGLAFEMREESFEHKTSSGVLCSTNKVNYPYCLGSSQVEKEINEYYTNIIQSYKDASGEDIDELYQNMEDAEALDRLPLYEDLEAEVTYNKNGYLSILQWTHFWGGGAHPYHYERGLNFDTQTAEQLAYTAFFKGEPAAVNALLERRGEAENAGREGWYENSEFILTDEGVRFYIWHGDAIERQQLVIPFSDPGAPFVVLSEAENTTASAQILSEAEIRDLFIQANQLYIGWLSNAFTPELVWDRSVKVDNKTYVYIEPTEFDSVQALEEALSRRFSEDLYRDRVDNYYIMLNGEMYGFEALGQGGDAPASSLKLTVKTATSTDCTFSVTVYSDYYDPYTSDYHMKMQDGNWIFTDSFNGCMDLYFHNDMPWID